MSKSKQQKKKSKKVVPKKSKRKKEELGAKFKQKFQSAKPILIFWGGFLLLISLYFVISFSSFYTDYILSPISIMYAELSSLILNVFGQGTSTNGFEIINSGFSISVKKGCDGVAATIFYLACVLLFPAARTQKLKGALWGIILLSILNLVRVISLFLIGAYAYDWFDFMHVEFWQVAYIGIAIFLYGIWLYWVFNQNKKITDAEAA